MKTKSLKNIFWYCPKLVSLQHRPPPPKLPYMPPPTTPARWELGVIFLYHFMDFIARICQLLTYYILTLHVYINTYTVYVCMNSPAYSCTTAHPLSKLKQHIHILLYGRQYLLQTWYQYGFSWQTIRMVGPLWMATVICCSTQLYVNEHQGMGICSLIYMKRWEEHYADGTQPPKINT